MQLYELIDGISHETAVIPGSFEVKKITTALCEAGENTLFVCIKSVKQTHERNFDKINISNVGAVICEKDDAEYITQEKIIVEKSRRALAFLYSKFYQID